MKGICWCCQKEAELTFDTACSQECYEKARDAIRVDDNRFIGVGFMEEPSWFMFIMEQPLGGFRWEFTDAPPEDYLTKPHKHQKVWVTNFNPRDLMSTPNKALYEELRRISSRIQAACYGDDEKDWVNADDARSLDRIAEQFKPPQEAVLCYPVKVDRQEVLDRESVAIAELNDQSELIERIRKGKEKND